MLEPGTWQGDIDVGEQFYNYLLHPDVRPYCSVDVNPYLADVSTVARLALLVWLHCVMGQVIPPWMCEDASTC
jgi:hypothetical protein